MQQAQYQQALGLQLSDRQEKAHANPPTEVAAVAVGDHAALSPEKLNPLFGTANTDGNIGKHSTSGQTGSNLLEFHAATTADMNMNRVPWVSAK